MKSCIPASRILVFCIHGLGAPAFCAEPTQVLPDIPQVVVKRFSDSVKQLGGLFPLASDPYKSVQEAPTQPGAVIDFEEGSPLGRVLRMLANQAGINYLEPQFDPNETVAISLHGVSAREAFQRIAESRGYRVLERNGVVELSLIHI